MSSTLTPAEKRRRLIISLQTAPVRVCYTLHECALCPLEIRQGDVYRDRGYGRRAHCECVPEVAP